jgi:long-subunit fatty acid transport protein
MQHNPAGLAQQPGFSFLVDLQVIRHDVTFSRQDPGFDPENPSTLINTVASRPDPFLLPFFAATYGFPIAGRNFTIGLGLFAPPSQGKYDYTLPNYAKDDMGKYLESPNRNAPQRYALLSNNIVIAYPTLSLAYDIHPKIQVGISAQLTLANFAQAQTLYGGDVLCPSVSSCELDKNSEYNPRRQLSEKGDYDATVAIDLPGQVGFTGILGVMVRPTEWLSFGGSVRPPIPFRGRGKITVQLSEFFTNAGATVSGDTANLTMTLPLELKFGARVVPIAGLGINFDFVYQGWNSIDQLLLTPENVTISSAPGAPGTPIAPFGLRKNWMPTWSVRLGASYRVFKYLSVHAGAMYETGAAPTSTYSVDWTHPTRVIVTGGFTGHLGPIDVIVGGLYTPTVTTVVTDSIVTRGQTNPEISPGVVGNGIYTSGAWGLNFGVRGHFGAAAPAAKPLVAAPMAPPELAPESALKAEPTQVPQG